MERKRNLSSDALHDPRRPVRATFVVVFAKAIRPVGGTKLFLGGIQPMNRLIQTAMGSVALGATSLFALAGPAPVQAQPQEGLVNVHISDVTVQVPIAVAANVCDLNVNTLAEQLDAGDTSCDSVADPTATFTPAGSGGGGRQSGLVNVFASDLTIQVPVGVAANICDVSANVLARQLAVGDDTCEATAVPDATG